MSESCHPQSHAVRNAFAIDTTSTNHKVIALAGNPNVGKTTLFNALTGLRQRTGNWPGKTVTRAQGTVLHAGHKMTLVDLPGTYSLLANSEDEQVARDFLVFGKPDAVIVVVDATALERNLNLVLQVLEITEETVIAVNLMDEATKKHISLDLDVLQDRLGVPVVPIVARDRKGLSDLLDKVIALDAGELHTHPRRLSYGEEIEHIVATILPDLEDALGDVVNARWLALRIAEGDTKALQSLEEYLGTSYRQPSPVESTVQEAMA